MHNLFVKCAFLLSLAVCASCYDFQDPYYNQVLAADIQDLENATQYEEEAEELHSRKRRAAITTTMKPTAAPPKEDCKPISYYPCCDVNPSEPTPQETEFRRACYKQIFLKKDEVKTNKTSTYDPFNCEKIIKMRNDILCLTQCMAEKMKMADSDGNLLPAGMAKYIAEKYNGTWVAPLAKTISMKCAKQVDEITTNYIKNKPVGTCNPAFSELSFCVFKEVQMSCPADQIKNTKRCDSFRSYAKKYPVNTM